MNWKLLTRYLSDQCNDSERRQVKHWLSENLENREFMCSVKKIWDVEPHSNFEFDAEQAWNRFKEKNIQKGEYYSLANLQSITETHRRSSGNKNKWALYVSSIAALFLLVFFFAYRIDQFKNTFDDEQSHLTMQEIVTEKGQKTSFTLSDGTRVMLNAESSLRIPSTFVNKKREVFLNGEAYFEVSHIENASFIVHSANFYTRVLGTKFVVSSYPDDKNSRVAVTEGKVSLNNEAETEPLGFVIPNQLGTITQKGDAKIETIENVQDFLGWTTGKLIFNETPLREIKPRLERWYDIKVQIDDPALLSKKLTASFDKEPLSEVLKVITISLELEYVYDKKNRTISLFNYDSNANQ